MFFEEREKRSKLGRLLKGGRSQRDGGEGVVVVVVNTYLFSHESGVYGG